MADFIQIDGIGLEVLVEGDYVGLDGVGLEALVIPGEQAYFIRLDGVGLEVLCAEGGGGLVVQVACQDIGVESLPATGFYEFHRKYPTFDENHQFETQPGCMKWPWLT